MVATEQSSLASIRAIQHLDSQGNPIGWSSDQNPCEIWTDTSQVEPDRSNPTRSRWERPLDTIRAFEAAIDGNYSRKSYARTGQNTTYITGARTHFVSGNNADWPFHTDSDAQSSYNRRSSYYGGSYFLLSLPSGRISSESCCDLTSLWRRRIVSTVRKTPFPWKQDLTLWPSQMLSIMDRFP